ncbi:MAG: hypothetical protein JXB08_01870 [Bacilli bacterium]|nr:hypothetical protein [Bacilli bacterium]MBN2876024.1 hypothetical protein [Bacilli bacterium]
MYKFDTKLKDIHAKDLLFVILYGGVISILMGVALGLLDYYIQRLTAGLGVALSFSMLLFFLSAMYIGRTVRKQYLNPHIFYILFTGFFLVIQALIIMLFPSIYYNALYYNDYSLLYTPAVYWFMFQSYIATLVSSLLSLNFWVLLEVLFLAVGTYIGIKQTY